jgi:hypothetical protein
MTFFLAAVSIGTCPRVFHVSKAERDRILPGRGRQLANSQRPPGNYAERPWDELPECSGSIRHLRD